MSRTFVDGKVHEVFDDDDLDASYQAEFTSEGGVAVHVEVHRGGQILVKVPVTQFGPDEAYGFGEES